MQPMVEFALRALRGAQDTYYRMREKIEVAREDKTLDALLEDTARFAEAQIVRSFERGYPLHGISGRFTPYREGTGMGKDFHWKIELQHGYSNLAHSAPGWAISMTCYVKGRAEHAVLISPFTDEEFVVSRGQGTRFNQHRMRTQPIAQIEDTRVAMSVPDRWMRARYFEQYQAVTRTVAPQVDTIRSSGCPLLDLVDFVAGRVDFALAFGLDEYDTHLAALMLKETGAIVAPLNGSPRIEPETVLMASHQRLFPVLIRQFAAIAS